VCTSTRTRQSRSGSRWALGSSVTSWGSTWAYGKLVSGFVKDQVKHAPHVDADGQLSQDEEARLYAHYGIAYTEHTGSDAIDAQAADADATTAPGRLRQVDESEHQTATVAIAPDNAET
jgi:hypothetical protein